MRVSNILDEIHATLDPRLWADPASEKPILKSIHSHWIKKEVYHILEASGYTNVEDWLTLVLTGSLTTYQYSDESDVDVSLFIDSRIFPEWSRAEMIALMVERLDGRTLPGTPFPLQDFVVGEGIKPSDLYKPGLRSGYNIDNGKWIVPPERDRVHDVRAKQGGFYAWALQMADKMERLLQYEPERAIEFWHIIHKKRKRDMAGGKGDFSESNIVYKMLANRNLFPAISQISGEYIARHEATRDNSVPNIMYHNSPRRNRQNILDRGLQVAFDNGAGYTEPGIYFSADPISSPTEDTYAVDVSDYEPIRDPFSDEWKDQGGSYYLPHDVPAHRISLFPQISDASGEYIAGAHVVAESPTMYHVAPSEYQETIEHNGLVPNAPIEGDYPHGVYLFPDEANARFFAEHMENRDRDEYGDDPANERHIWQVNTEGLQLRDDPAVDPNDEFQYEYPVPLRSLYTTDPVGPERLRRIAGIRLADVPKIPPHLRNMQEPTPDKKVNLAKEFEVGKSHCGNCSMFWKNKSGSGHCWGYGEYDVETTEVCDSWAPGKAFHTSAATDTEARVLFNKFRPEQKHPPIKGGESSLPWIYEPATGVVHLGPPQSYHWELIERTPELRGQYENAWEGAPTNQTSNIHGAMLWPSRKTEFMGDRPIEPETKQAINKALGAPEEDEGIHWNFLRDN